MGLRSENGAQERKNKYGGDTFFHSGNDTRKRQWFEAGREGKKAGRPVGLPFNGGLGSGKDFLKRRIYGKGKRRD